MEAFYISLAALILFSDAVYLALRVGIGDRFLRSREIRIRKMSNRNKRPYLKLYMYAKY